ASRGACSPRSPSETSPPFRRALCRRTFSNPPSDQTNPSDSDRRSASGELPREPAARSAASGPRQSRMRRRPPKPRALSRPETPGPARPGPGRKDGAYLDGRDFAQITSRALGPGSLLSPAHLAISPAHGAGEQDRVRSPLERSGQEYSWHIKEFTAIHQHMAQVHQRPLAGLGGGDRARFVAHGLALHKVGARLEFLRVRLP